MENDIIRVLIIDDEPPARRRIRDLLAPRKDFEIVGESRNGREALKDIRHLRPDLVFLDIQMPDLDGFGVLRELPEDFVPALVFVSAYDRFALKAFEANALDYLLKPYDDERFEKALLRARLLIERDGTAELSRRVGRLLSGLEAAQVASPSPSATWPKKVLVKRGPKQILLEWDQVEWIEAAGVYAELHTVERSYLLRETMNRLQERLDSSRFARIHRSAIVHLDAVTALYPLSHGEAEVHLRSGKRLKLSRTYRESFERSVTK